MKKVKIKNFAEVITGGTPSTTKEEYWLNGNIPWLNSGELNQKIILTSKNYITELGLKNSSSKMMPKDSVLIALTGSTTGVVGYLTFEACANQSVTGIVPSENHEPKFLYYYLNSIRQKVIQDAYGGAQPHISQGYVKDLEIPLPSLAEQKAIAAKLDKAQEIIRYNEEIIAKYDALMQALFLDMFGDPVKNEKGWEKKTLKEICIKIGSGSTPRGGKESYKKEGISLIRSMNVYDRKFLYKDLAFIDEVQAERLKNVIVEEKDILFNITGASVCRSTIVPKEILPARVNQHVAIIRPKSTLSNYLYLNHFLISGVVKRKLLKIGSGGGAVMEAITKEQLEKFEIILPPIERQNQFAARVLAIEFQKQQAQESLAKSQELFNSLLQQSFRSK